MHQEDSISVHEYHAAYEASGAKLQSRSDSQHAKMMIAENVRAQEMREKETSELAPGAYMMAKIVEKNGNRYRSGRDDHGGYMTTDDYANLYRSRRIQRIHENGGTAAWEEGTLESQSVRAASLADTSRNISREEPVRSVRESGVTSRRRAASAQARREGASEVGIPRNGSSSTPQGQIRPRTTTAEGAKRAGKAPMSAPMSSMRTSSATPVVRRETATITRPIGQHSVTEWFPNNERYIRVRNQKRFPLAMVMMIIAVSVSLMLIVCGSVMTSHMEREICAMNNELRNLEKQAEELEGDLALKNDPIKMEQLATEMGMVRSEYVEMRMLRANAEERTVVYEDREPSTFSLATLLSAIGFFKH